MSKGAETRQTILHHGVEAAARVGLSGLTIGELATATGLSKSGLFAHVKSKEALQLQVLAQAREQFIDDVIRPALTVQRGEPRVRALFDRWLIVLRDNMPGGCLFIKSAVEYDERPGPVREQLVRDHTDLRESVAQVFRTGIGEGHFRDDADPAQFASDVQGVMFSYYHAHRLLNDPQAEAQARRAFEALIAAARR